MTPVLVLVGLKLVAHLLTNGRYGYFGDELYYLARSERLDLGYVDHPPLAFALARLSRALLGDSLPALRFLPAVAGALVVLATGRMARRLGGGSFAAALAALCVLVGPVFLGVHTIFSVNPFDQLLWVAALAVLVELLRREAPRLWLVFGVVAGIGLMNKLTVLFLGAAVAAALVLTPRRRDLAGPWPWLGGLAALGLLLPYLLWQAGHGWPAVEYYRAYSGGQTYAVSPAGFLYEQVMAVHPVTLPIWLAGLASCLAPRSPYRLLGVAFAVLWVGFTGLHVKYYLLAPAYPVLFAAGAVALERFLARRRWRGVKSTVVAAVALVGLLAAPLSLPILPLERLVRFAGRVGGDAGVTIERKGRGRIPGHFAEMLGWEELAAAVAAVHAALPPDERARACVLADTYREAAAIDRFGPAHGLPHAISGHLDYHRWGPGDCTGEVVVAVGKFEDTLRAVFRDVAPAAVIRCAHCAPDYDDLPVHVCRGLAMPRAAAWARLKHYD